MATRYYKGLRAVLLPLFLLLSLVLTSTSLASATEVVNDDGINPIQAVAQCDPSGLVLTNTNIVSAAPVVVDVDTAETVLAYDEANKLGTDESTTLQVPDGTYEVRGFFLPDLAPGNPVIVTVDCQDTEPVDSDGDGVPDESDQCSDTPANTEVDDAGCEIEDDGSNGNGQATCPTTDGWTKIDAASTNDVLDDGSTLSWANGTVNYDLADGATLDLCVKSGNQAFPDEPDNKLFAREGLSGSGSVSTDNKSISHVSWRYTPPEDEEELCPEDSDRSGEPVDDEPCDKTDVIQVPAQPSVMDPCDPNNATWVVPSDTEVLDWEVNESNLVVTILVDNTEFPDGSTSNNFGPAPESNVDPCPIVEPTGDVLSECVYYDAEYYPVDDPEDATFAYTEANVLLDNRDSNVDVRFRTFVSELGDEFLLDDWIVPAGTLDDVVRYAVVDEAKFSIWANADLESDELGVLVFEGTVSAIDGCNIPDKPDPKPETESMHVEFIDECGTSSDGYVITATDGVDVTVDDQRDADGVGTVTITGDLIDEKGSVLTGRAEWSFDFTNDPCKSHTPDPKTPDDPDPKTPVVYEPGDGDSMTAGDLAVISQDSSSLSVLGLALMMLFGGFLAAMTLVITVGRRKMTVS